MCLLFNIISAFFPSPSIRLRILLLLLVVLRLHLPRLQLRPLLARQITQQNHLLRTRWFYRQAVRHRIVNVKVGFLERWRYKQVNVRCWESKVKSSDRFDVYFCNRFFNCRTLEMVVHSLKSIWPNTHWTWDERMMYLFLKWKNYLFLFTWL